MRRGLGICVAVMAGFLASRASAQTITPLASTDDLRAVCAAPDSARYFSLTLAAAGFALEPYDAKRARLAVDVARGLHGPRGLELVLHDIAGRATMAPSSLDIAVPADAAEGASLAAAHQRGDLLLRLTFQLASPKDGSPVCATTLSTDGEGIRAAIEPVAFEMFRGDVRVATGESARWSGGREIAAPVTSPRVVVSAPRLTHSGTRAPANVTRAATTLVPGLLACYRLGLGEEPTLQGPFVAGIDVAPDGRVRAARAELDGLGAPEVTSCVLKLVRGARFPGAADRLSIAMRFSDG